MLKTLFISKVRIKILRLFILHPDVPYHIRGVVREVDEEINAVRRELLRLEKINLLKSERKGNRVYYGLNTDFLLYPELLGMFYKQFGLGGEFIKAKKRLGDVRFAFLTRAFTKGLRTNMHDVDLVIVGNVNMKYLGEAVQKAEKQIGREVNYTVMSPDEFELRKKRRDAFVTGILSGSKVMLIGDEDELVL